MPGKKIKAGHRGNSDEECKVAYRLGDDATGSRDIYQLKHMNQSDSEIVSLLWDG